MPSASFSLPVTWREPMYCKNRLWAGNIPCRVFLRAKRKHATRVETLLGVPDILRVASRTRYRNDRIQCERQSFPGHGCRTHGHDSTRAQSSIPPYRTYCKGKIHLPLPRVSPSRAAHYADPWHEIGAPNGDHESTLLS